MVFPFGNPGQEDLEAFDGELLKARRERRERVSINEPPENTPEQPLVVPRWLARKRLAESIRNRGQLMGVQHDGNDIAFNARTEGHREEALIRLSPPEPDPVRRRPVSPLRYAMDSANRSARFITQFLERAEGSSALPVTRGRVGFGSFPVVTVPQGEIDRARPSPLAVAELGDPRLAEAAGPLSVPPRGGTAALAAAQAGQRRIDFIRGPYNHTEMNRRVLSHWPNAENPDDITWAHMVAERDEALAEWAPLEQKYKNLFGGRGPQFSAAESEEYLSARKRVESIGAAMSDTGPQPDIAAWQVATMTVLESLGALEDAPRKAIRAATANVNAAILTSFGQTGDFSATRQEAFEAYDEVYDGLPVFIRRPYEELLRPSNWVIGLGGGTMARVVARAPGGAILGAALKPISSGPAGQRIIIEATTIAAGRVGYEYTEGAPGWVRFAAGGTAMLMTANAKAVTSPLFNNMREAWRGHTGIKARDEIRTMLMEPAERAPVTITGGSRAGEAARAEQRGVQRGAERAARAEATLPPVADGMTRLYRVEPASGEVRSLIGASKQERESFMAAGGAEARGRWFTSRMSAVGFYRSTLDQARVPAVVQYVDVPTSRLREFSASAAAEPIAGRLPEEFSRAPDEFFLPRDIAEGRAVFDPLPPVADEPLTGEVIDPNKEPILPGETRDEWFERVWEPRMKTVTREEAIARAERLGTLDDYSRAVIDANYDRWEGVINPRPFPSERVVPVEDLSGQALEVEAFRVGIDAERVLREADAAGLDNDAARARLQGLVREARAALPAPTQGALEAPDVAARIAARRAEMQAARAERLERLPESVKAGRDLDAVRGEIERLTRSRDTLAQTIQHDRRRGLLGEGTDADLNEWTRLDRAIKDAETREEAMVREYVRSGPPGTPAGDAAAKLWLRNTLGELRDVIDDHRAAIGRAKKLLLDAGFTEEDFADPQSWPSAYRRVLSRLDQGVALGEFLEKNPNIASAPGRSSTSGVADEIKDARREFVDTTADLRGVISEESRVLDQLRKLEGRDVSFGGAEGEVDRIAPGERGPLREAGEGEVIAGSVFGFVPGGRGRPSTMERLSGVPDVIKRIVRDGMTGVRDRTPYRGNNVYTESLTTTTARAAHLAGLENQSVPPMVMQALSDTVINPLGPVDRWFANAPYYIDRAAKSLRPKLGQLPLVHESNVAGGNVYALEITRSTPSRVRYLEEIENLFGSTDKLPERMEYIGPDEITYANRRADGSHFAGKTVKAADYPIHGTIIDAYYHPEWYAMTQRERSTLFDVMARLDNRNSLYSEELRAGYGIEIGEHGGRWSATIPERTGKGRAHIPSIGTEELATAANGRELSLSGRLRERRFETLITRLESGEVGQRFVPLTDLRQLYTGLDAAKAAEAARATIRYGLGGVPVSATDARGAAPPVGGMTLMEQFGTYVPDAEAVQLEKLIGGDTQGAWVLRFIDGWRQGRLGGDVSLLTIQGSLNWFASPRLASMQIIHGMKTAAGEHDILRAFRQDAFLKDLAERPERWMDFAFHTGTPIAAGTPKEWAAGWLRHVHVPKFSEGGPLTDWSFADLNEGTYLGLIRGMENIYDQSQAMLIREGHDPAIAKHAAASIVTKVVPWTNARRSGVNPGRAAVERAAFTSIAFIREPINFTVIAARGLAKLMLNPGQLPHVPGVIVTPGTIGQWAQLTPEERLGTQMFIQMMGTITGTSVTSAAVTARARGLTVEEAVERAVDPSGPDFLKLFVPTWPGGKVYGMPIGGPYRGLIRAVTLTVSGDWKGGIVDYLGSRLGPAIGTALDVVRNRDFFGEEIRRAPAEGASRWPAELERLGRALMYVGEQALPISVEPPLTALRTGRPVDWATAAESGAEFLGQGAKPPSAFEQLEIARRRGGMALHDMDATQKIALGMGAAQVAASSGARTLAELRKAIGSRAANQYAEQANIGESAEARRKYNEELRIRHENGDKDATALLVGVTAQLELEGLLRTVQVAGGPDKRAYRAGRLPIIAEQFAQTEIFDDFFNDFRDSDNRIDRLTAEWYDLIDQATERVTVRGEEVSLGVDYEVLEKLELEFFQRLESEEPGLAALVDANVNTPPRGANQIEVELRRLRRDLEGAGRWEIEGEVFEENREAFLLDLENNRFIQLGQNIYDLGLGLKEARGGLAGIDIPEGTLRAIEQEATTIHQAVKMLTSAITAQLMAGRGPGRGGRLGMDHALAAQRAKNEVNRLPAMTRHNARVQDATVEWAKDNTDLARRAQEWGYIGVGDEFQKAIGRAEEESSPPESKRQADHELTEQMAASFAEGNSYGQVAIQFDMTRDAVRSRLKRMAGGSPVETLRSNSESETA